MLPSRDFDARTIEFLTKYGFYAKSALDVGARWHPEHGAGLWKGLARFGVTDYRIVEIWPANVAALKEHDFHAIEGDVRRLAHFVGKGAVDCVCWFHGPEHLGAFAEIREALMQCAQVAKKYVLLSFPIGKEPQGAMDGNPYEEHRFVLEQDMIPRVANCFPSGKVAWRIYVRPPRQVGEYTVKFNPNCVLLWEKKGV